MSFDVILVGGGLQNALIALALHTRQPGARIALVEKGDTLGGNHTWSFHVDDVPASARSFVDLLVEHRWPSYQVRFPNLERRLMHAYASLSSARLHDATVQAFAGSPGSAIFLQSEALVVGDRGVDLAAGRTLSADVVIDARGPDVSMAERAGAVGYQKFVGLELELVAPAAVTEPILMDATVEQFDGLRFVYSLPLGPTRWLVEDTYFSNTATLDVPRLRYQILAYAHARWGRIKSVIREERGVLPLPWRDGSLAPRRARTGALAAGYGGGWFHPTTGYSFPIALRVAERIATIDVRHLGHGDMDDLIAEHRRQSRFCYLLNRLLFLGIEPRHRWRAMSRFYSLPEDTIRRFYALTLSRRDRTRILFGRPPQGLSLRGMLAVMEA